MFSVDLVDDYSRLTLNLCVLIVFCEHLVKSAECTPGHHLIISMIGYLSSVHCATSRDNYYTHVIRPSSISPSSSPIIHPRPSRPTFYYLLSTL
jgi:hypothetical protein